MNCHVRYLVELPLGWTTDEGECSSQMEGTTVTSRATTDPATGNSVAHFAHTFTVDLCFDINQLDMMKVKGIQALSVTVTVQMSAVRVTAVTVTVCYSDRFGNPRFICTLRRPVMGRFCRQG